MLLEVVVRFWPQQKAGFKWGGRGEGNSLEVTVGLARAEVGLLKEG